MTRKKYWLISLIWQCVALVMFFVPGTAMWKVYQTQSMGAVVKKKVSESFFDAATCIDDCTKIDNQILYVYLLLLIVSIVFSLLFMLNKLKINKISFLIMSVPALVFGVWFIESEFLASNELFGFNTVVKFFSSLSIQSFGYIAAIIIIGILIYSVVGIVMDSKGSFIESDNTNVKINDSKNHSESIDLLLEYKALLDKGVISQEEFEAKKKEIL